MNTLAVVGGVYRERCRLPVRTDDPWGSGGRAAAVIAGLGLEVILHSPVEARNAPVLASLAENFKFQTAETTVKTSPEFRYDHGLSTPVIWPLVAPDIIQLDVEAENTLVFGMLEAQCRVRKMRCVRPAESDFAGTYSTCLKFAQAGVCPKRHRNKGIDWD